MRRMLDDQTTMFLFAASRGDTHTISLMCDQGFDPNNADYDHRTALMVASMKGNTDVVQLILQYKACPNMTDMHGSSALLEAVKNGHESTMELLFQHGADLCMSESQAASVLCQAVFDGDILLLKRLLKAGIDINAADYDKRTAAHIAAAEGNVAAIRILAEKGADLTLSDRWGNTVQDEARRSNARQLLLFLEERKEEWPRRDLLNNSSLEFIWLRMPFFLVASAGFAAIAFLMRVQYCIYFVKKQFFCPMDFDIAFLITIVLVIVSAVIYLVHGCWRVHFFLLYI